MLSLIPAERNSKIHAESLAKKLKGCRYSYTDGNLKRHFTTRPMLVDQVWKRPDTFSDLFIRTAWSSTDYQKLCSDFVLILSILVEIEWQDLDTAFKSLFFDHPKRTDHNLPFTNDELGFLDPSSRKSFHIIQHAYAPFMIGESGKKVELSCEKILPFEADPQSIGEGSFSEVYKAKIPSECYIDIDSRNQKRVYRESHCLAFKQLYRKADYEREVSNLSVFSNSLKSHKNIVRYIQAVSQGDQFRIFFPFADHGSLRDLLSKPTSDDLSITNQSLMCSLHNLVDGVAFIHDAMFVGQNEFGSYRYGAHLDLKPANILVYPNPKDIKGAGVWKITDFGISSFKDVNDQITSQGPYGEVLDRLGTSPDQPSGMTGPRDQLGACCPPELHPLKKVPFRGYPVDMWSVGCILIDVLCFALGGEDCITRFRNARTAKNQEDDYFFEVLGPDQSCEFAVKDIVADFLENLLVDYPKQRRWVKECILIICEVLRLEPKYRSPAKEVSKRLIDLSFDENGDNPLESWLREYGTKWDTNPPRLPNTHPTAVQRGQILQELISHDRQIDINSLGNKADESRQTSTATSSQIPKNLRGDHQASLTNETSQSFHIRTLEVTAADQTLLEDEFIQALKTPDLQNPPIQIEESRLHSSPQEERKNAFVLSRQRSTNLLGPSRDERRQVFSGFIESEELENRPQQTSSPADEPQQEIDSVERCRCERGRPKLFCTPVMLSNIFGRLIIPGIASRKSPCGLPLCKNKSSWSWTMSYIFPSKLLAKAFFLRFVKCPLTRPTPGLYMRGTLSGPSGLLRLIEQDDVGAIQMLFEKRHNTPNDIEPMGFSALTCAINLEKVEACKFLLKAGADASLQDSFGISAIDYAWTAAFENRLDPTTLKFLRNDPRFFLKDKDDPDFVDFVEDYQFSKIHLLVLGVLSTSDFEGELEDTEIEVVNQADADGKTPLLWACRRGDETSVRLLLQRGADPKISDTMRRSPLHMACRAKETSIIERLLRYGADPRAENFIRETPVHYACYEDCCDSLLQPLVKKGIDVNAPSKYNLTPLDIVVHKDHRPGTEYLLDCGALAAAPATGDWNQRPLGRAILYQAHQSAGVLLRTGCEVDFVDSQRKNVLHFIAEHGNLETTRCMRVLRLGAEYADQPNKMGRTPSDVAKLRKNDESFVRAFEDLVRDIREQDFSENYVDARS